MYEQAKYAAYQNAAQTTASKTKQVVMLYDGLVRIIQQAKEAIEENNVETRYNLLDRADAIIAGLTASLDHENGGEISEILERYYGSIDMRLMHVQRSNEAEVLAQVIKELKMMREAWYQIDEGQVEDVSSELPPAPETTAKSQEEAAVAEEEREVQAEESPSEDSSENSDMMALAELEETISLSV